LHVVEHLTAPTEFFSEARRVLRPGGHLVIATPNASGLGARLMKDKWQGFSDPTHIALNAASYWRNLVTDAGFTICREGTTGLTGIPGFNRMPLGLIHWIPTFFFGFYPWELGEAYICVALKHEE
jgi:SAM-dependent methyltransferase